MSLRASYNEAIRILPNGYVGISCSYTNPQYDLDVFGTIRATTIIPSDSVFKTKIKKLKKERIAGIYNLEAKQYKYKMANEIFPAAEVSDSGSVKTDEPFIDTLTHFGLLAQEVQVLYPEVVQADADGHLNLNYTELIPVIIEALKEQKSRIDDLEEKLKQKNAELDNLKIGITNTSIKEKAAYLNQNIPNPFSQDTKITFYLPPDIKTAVLYVYNLQGKQVKSEKLFQREDGEIIIYGSELDPGIYYYSIVADGNVVGTQTMILTSN